MLQSLVQIGGRDESRSEAKLSQNFQKSKILKIAIFGLSRNACSWPLEELGLKELVVPMVTSRLVASDWPGRSRNIPKKSAQNGKNFRFDLLPISTFSDSQNLKKFGSS